LGKGIATDGDSGVVVDHIFTQQSTREVAHRDKETYSFYNAEQFGDTDYFTSTGNLI
jgi:hypothetical protein